MILVRYADRVSFWNWCVDQGFDPEYDGTVDSYNRTYDRWWIKNEKQLLIAKLRWEHA